MSYRFSSTLYLNIHPLLIRQLSRLYQNLIHMFLHSNRSNGLGPLHMYFYLNRYIFSIASKNNLKKIYSRQYQCDAIGYKTLNKKYSQSSKTISSNTSSKEYIFHKSLIYMTIFDTIKLSNKVYSISKSEMTYESIIKFKNQNC